MYALRDILRSPVGGSILVAAVLAVVLARTRLARWVVYATPLLLWFWAEAGRFDGQRHVNQKFDATFFVWISSVELRALGGLAVLLLAAPIGAAVGKLLRARRGSLLGLAALGPCGMGLLASSALTLRAVPLMLDLPAAEDRLGALRTVIARTDTLLGAGALLSIVMCTVLAFRMLRRERRVEAR
jgi:hypothetical protein